MTKQNSIKYRPRKKIAEEPLELSRARHLEEPICVGGLREVQSIKLGQVNLRDIFFYRDFQRYMSRYWKCHISAAAYSVLDMIFDRTIGWGKWWEWISLHQFAQGVWNKKGVFSDGTGLGKRTIQRALKELLEIGMIFCKGNRGRAAKFAVNFFWKPPEFKYVSGTTTFSPAGSESYWETMASDQARKVMALLEHYGPEAYTRELNDETEPEILFPPVSL